MLDLNKIDLGKDEAESDNKLEEYFLKTPSYNNAFTGKKTIIIGRKGSGKSAIFKLMKEELKSENIFVFPITPSEYSINALKDLKEQNISGEQAHTNAWKITFLSLVVCSLIDKGRFPKGSILNFSGEKREARKLYKYFKDSYIPRSDNLKAIIDRIIEILTNVRTQWAWLERHDEVTPLSLSKKIENVLLGMWPTNTKVCILIDKLDDNWDASDESKNFMIGLLKATKEINTEFDGKVVVTIFLRSDIYHSLIFHDQDKIREYVEEIFWDVEELKDVICERVKVSLDLGKLENKEIWDMLFSDEKYRSNARPEKYIIDRTFKKPRDIISFIKSSIEIAKRSGHKEIKKNDTMVAEEQTYSQSKYQDLVIEYEKNYPYIKELLNRFANSKHKLTIEELRSEIDKFKRDHSLDKDTDMIIDDLFRISFIGIKRSGNVGVKQKAGTSFYYFYDDPSIRPLSYKEFYIHPSLRKTLNITETRSRKS